MIAETKALSPEEISQEVRRIISIQEKRPRVICFDYFDTLVSRTIEPETTKRLAANQLYSIMDCGLEGSMLYDLRRVLELKTCNENAAKGLDPDFNLCELAERYFNIIKEVTTIPVFLTKEAFVEIFINIEVQVEKTTQKICPDMVELLIHVKKSGIKTCLISDFYLPGNHFEKMLSHHGLVPYFDAVYVSADHCLTKGCSGRLYEHVCKDLACTPSQLLMIGDNEHADISMARKVGLNVYHLDHTKRKMSQGKSSDPMKDKQRCLDSEKYLETIMGRHTINFPEMGYTLWLFTHRLFKRLIRDQVTEVFFCSKEGEFLKRLFLQYQKLRFGGCIISAHYLLVSRKSTYICSLKPLQEENFSRLFAHYHDISLKEFLLSLNFSEKQVIDLCNNHRFDCDGRYQRLSSQPHFKNLLDTDDFRELYESHRNEQRENFLRYLKIFNSNNDKNELSLVDVGWKGSIQNNIFLALKSEKKIRGYYIGLLSPTEVTEDNIKSGILFSDTPTNSPFIHVYNNNRSLFEMILGASHGSADGYFSKGQYRNCGKERKSTTFQAEYIPEDLCVTVLDLPEERALFEKNIRPIQDVILEINKDITTHYVLSGGSHPDAEWFARRHARMVFTPKKEEVDFYSRLYHLENFGLFEFTNFQATDKIPLFQRIKNLKILLQNPAGILETGVWPPIILKRLGLSFLQPIDAQKRYRKIFGRDS